jgi:hypothetical protein
MHVNFTSKTCSERGADILHLYSKDTTPTITWNFIQTAGSAAAPTSIFHLRGNKDQIRPDGNGAFDVVVRSAKVPAAGELVSLDGSKFTFTRGWFQNVGGRGLADTTSSSASFNYVSCYIETGIVYSLLRILDSGSEVDYAGPWTEYDFWAPLCTLPSCPVANGVFDYVHPENAVVDVTSDAYVSCYRVVNCAFRRTTARGHHGGAIYTSGTRGALCG